MRITLLATAGLALAAVNAHAATYCVTPPGGSDPACPAGGVVKSTIQDALTTADNSQTTDDTILLGAGTFSVSTALQYGNGNTASAHTNDLTIQGAGIDATKLVGATSSLAQIFYFGTTTPNNTEAINSLSLVLPDGFGTVSSAGILRATDLADIGVTAAGALGQTATAAVVTPNIADKSSTVSGLAVDLPLHSTDTNDINVPVGVDAELAPGQTSGVVSVVDSSISAGLPVSDASTRLVARRDRMHGLNIGISAAFPVMGNAENFVEDDQIAVSGSNGARAIVLSAFTNDSTLAVSHVTLTNAVKSGGFDSGFGITGNGHDSDVRIRNSVVTGFSNTIGGIFSGGTSTVTLSNSVVPTASDAPSGTTVTRVEPMVVADDPHLVDNGAGLLYPRFDSPAIDLGDGSFTNLGLDLARQSRWIDGNGDGTVAPDAGAIEYQRRPPTAAASVNSPAGGAPALFVGSGLDPDPGDTLSYSWLFSDGATSSEQSPAHTFGPGPFGGTLTVTDPTGLKGSAAATGTAAAIPVPPDKTAPVITKAAFSPKTFRASADADTATSAAKHAVGSTLGLTLSEQATLTVKIAERRSGRLSGKTCKAPTKKTKKAKRCTYYTTRATLTRTDLVAGARKVAFTGRVHGKALPPAGYRATLTAKDRAGNVSKGVTTTFTIVKH